MSNQSTCRAVTFGFAVDTPQKNGKLEIFYLRPLNLPFNETAHEIVAKVIRWGPGYVSMNGQISPTLLVVQMLGCPHSIDMHQY